jgi:hypothetical protein
MSEEDPDRPVVVATVPTEDIAAMISNRLASTGIKTQIVGTGMRTELPGQPSGFQVIVQAVDLERASDLIDDLDHPHASAPE